MSETGDQAVELDAPTLADVLDELREIRTLLEQQTADVARCDHGYVGICTYCITPMVEFHLGELVRSISNTAWEAMRRA